ncbi:hypothetical protein MUN78_09975 [Leucobacter allii]|uniref:Response regulatory domain-containing protein n=1 Tax=Leucobacter allii TaxID=2932247 RepID=A0ABY4FI18_9MICO|nr:hypothetical protein [Leucobacter allii]UOQ56030.1 hypothetical protein MUN78_09975 [Leucobacter allii]UOR00554.1 hypothetical protein MUN77_10265 [Leucobacter allii]
MEDHLLQRRHAELLVAAEGDLTTVYSGEDLAGFMDWLRESAEGERPHLLLLDLMVDRGKDADPELVERLVEAGLRIIVLSAMASPPLVRRMVRAGVHGVLGKRDREEDILAAIRSVLGGQSWMSQELATVIAHDPRRPKLSDQEERTLVLYASGLSLDAVAAAIGVKRDTAKKYLQRLRAKYAAAGRPMRTRFDLSRVASEDGYIALHMPEMRLPGI